MTHLFRKIWSLGSGKKVVSYDTGNNLSGGIKKHLAEL